MSVPDDSASDYDYDSLFDEAEAKPNGEIQDEPGRTNDCPTAFTGPSRQPLALPKYVGPSPTAPMRSVENVGTIALPVSPQFFAERPCTPSSSAASHIVSKKRPRDIDDDNDNDQPRLIRARAADSTRSSRAGSITSDRATTRDGRGLSILVPRPKHLPSKPSDEGPLSNGIISFLTHDADFTAAIRSYVYLLANPPDSTKADTVKDASLHTAKHSRTKGRKKVPANAADWDVPYPFPDGEAPPGYLETWSLEKAKSLSKAMLSAVRRAVTKLELLRVERNASEFSNNVQLPLNEVNEKASVAAPLVMDWIRGAVKNEGIQIGIDISHLPPRIVDVLPGFQPASAKIDEPIWGKDIVAAVRDGAIDVQNSLQQNQQTHTAVGPLSPSDLPLPPFDFAAYQPPETALPQTHSITSPSITWGDLVMHSNIPGIPFDTSTLATGGEIAADIPPTVPAHLPASQLSFDQLMDPSLLFTHEATTVLSTDASAAGSTPNIPNADPGDQSVVDWLLATLNDPNGFSDTSSLMGTGSGTPSSANNVLPPLPTRIVASHPAPPYSDQTHLAPAAETTRNLPTLKSKRKRAPTKQEIVELQKQNASLLLSTASGPDDYDERTLVVKDVRSRASAVRTRLREELDVVERELWALDIEREVLSEVQRSMSGQDQWK